jgi:DNA-binding IclR family transcriptional regulator
MRTYIDQYESRKEIKMKVELGRLYPLHAGASSRVILAFLPEVEIDRVLSNGLAPLTANTISEVAYLRQLLEQIRFRGYAISTGERQLGAGSVAAAVFGADEQVIGSISLCGPADRFNSDSITRYVPLVVAAAARISLQMRPPLV